MISTFLLLILLTRYYSLTVCVSLSVDVELGGARCGGELEVSGRRIVAGHESKHGLVDGARLDELRIVDELADQLDQVDIVGRGGQLVDGTRLHRAHQAPHHERHIGLLEQDGELVVVELVLERERRQRRHQSCARRGGGRVVLGEKLVAALFEHVEDALDLLELELVLGTRLATLDLDHEASALLVVAQRHEVAHVLIQHAHACLARRRTLKRFCTISSKQATTYINTFVCGY